MSTVSSWKIMVGTLMLIPLFNQRIIIFKFRIKLLKELWIDFPSSLYARLLMLIQQIERWMLLIRNIRRIFNLIFGDFINWQNHWLILTQSIMGSVQVIDQLLKVQLFEMNFLISTSNGILQIWWDLCFTLIEALMNLRTLLKACLKM